jgi:hypothetical protein
VIRSRLIVCGLLALSPTVASAQDAASDTIPFHSHQWAAQFAGGTSFASLGVLRFTAPARAWLLDFQFSGGHSHERVYSNDTLKFESASSSAAANVRIGRRFYQGRGKSVVSFQTAGLLGGFDHWCQRSTQTPGSVGTCSNGWAAGAFGELGGAYLITRRFSIGGTATVAFSYHRSTSKTSSGGVGKYWVYSGSVQGLSFAATVYF